MPSQNTQYLYQARQARQVREGEVVVAKAQGVSLYQLMERAGAAAFALLMEQYPSLRELCVVCGKGNNGGDGYVVARLAQGHGTVVHLVQVGEPERLQGDAREAMLAWQRGGGTIMSEKALPLLLNQCDVVVDALLGTGLSGLVRSELVTLIDMLNHSGKPVLAIWLSIKAFQGPSVLDADGLNWLARHPDYNDLRVITPHPGEAARLLGCSIAEIEADRFAAVQVLQAQYGGVAVLKGAGTLICDGNKTYVCDAGNPGMASGGMGDVLAGVIGALLAQKLSLLSAARLGVLLHSCAADLCAQRHGEVGLLASDLPDEIRRLLNGKA